MTRIRISLPEKPVYHTTLIIQISDINYGGHLGNDRVLSLMHEVRLRWLKSLGFTSEVEIIPQTGIIVADSAVVYRTEAFHGDHIDCQLFIGERNVYGMDLFYELVNSETEKEIARGKTGIVFFNYRERKVSRIPDEFSKRSGA